MIDAKDLRIGNFISSYLNDIKVEEFTKVDATTIMIISAEVQPKLTSGNKINFKRIPLTPEVLIKIGLEQDDLNSEIWYDSEYRIFELSTDGVRYCYDYHAIGEANKYLHQLQNLYYALTSEELEIKL